MAVSSQTGNDTLILFGRSIVDFADGATIDLKRDADIASLKKGKNGNVLANQNRQGDVGTLTVRLVRGSSDHRFLLGKMNAQKQDLASFALVDGEYIKRIGDGKGGIISEVNTMADGIFKKVPDVMENVDGETSANVVEFVIIFGSVDTKLT